VVQCHYATLCCGIWGHGAWSALIASLDGDPCPETLPQPIPSPPYAALSAGISLLALKLPQVPQGAARTNKRRTES